MEAFAYAWPRSGGEEHPTSRLLYSSTLWVPTRHQSCSCFYRYLKDSFISLLQGKGALPPPPWTANKASSQLAATDAYLTNVHTLRCMHLRPCNVPPYRASAMHAMMQKKKNTTTATTNGATSCGNLSRRCSCHTTRAATPLFPSFSLCFSLSLLLASPLTHVDNSTLNCSSLNVRLPETPTPFPIAPLPLVYTTCCLPATRCGGL